MSNLDLAHVNTGVRAILRRPSMYNAFAEVIGGNRSREKHFKKHFSDPSIKSVLDIGCGTGVLLKTLSPDVEYHGCDMEESYLDYARAAYPGRGEFHLERVGEVERPEWLGKFSAINAHGLLHHLSDYDSRVLLRSSKRYLATGGFLVVADPVFFDGQSRWSRWIVSKDRGQNVRRLDDYVNLASESFESVQTTLIERNNRIGYSCLVMRLSSGT